MASCAVIAITGAPGAGKTEVGRRLIARCPPASVLLDSDHVAGIHPFAIDDAFYRLAAANIGACIENFLAWGARRIVLTGVLVPDGILAHLGPSLRDERLTWRFYGLQAAPSTLDARIAADTKPQDPEQRIQWAHLNETLRMVPHCRLIPTDERSLETVVDAIAAWEQLAEQPR